MIRAAPVVDPTAPLRREHELTICAHFGIGETVGRAAEVAGRPEGESPRSRRRLSFFRHIFALAWRSSGPLRRELKMTSRKTVALPSIAVLAVTGGLVVAGCGSSSSADTTTQQSQNAGAMKDESRRSMKDEAGGHEGRRRSA